MVIVTGAVVLGILLMEVIDGWTYTIAATSLALVALGIRSMRPAATDRSSVRRVVDRRDLVAIVVIYAIVVAFYRVAFVVVHDNDLMLFLNFAAGLLVGVAAPVLYTVWHRGRSLASLGLTTADLPRVARLAVLFAAVQFAITFVGYDLPAPRAWLTLLGMALMVGLFESIFFRGFVQERLQASFGPSVGVLGAAVLYGVYHLGYGMGSGEIVFLTGLGVVYALAYFAAGNILALWPLLTPLGGLFAQLESGDLAGRLPWASLLGFADVMALMATVLWLAHRHERKLRSGTAGRKPIRMMPRITA